MLHETLPTLSLRGTTTTHVFFVAVTIVHSSRRLNRNDLVSLPAELFRGTPTLTEL